MPPNTSWDAWISLKGECIAMKNRFGMISQREVDATLRRSTKRKANQEPEKIITVTFINESADLYETERHLLVLDTNRSRHALYHCILTKLQDKWSLSIDFFQIPGIMNSVSEVKCTIENIDEMQEQITNIKPGFITLLPNNGFLAIKMEQAKDLYNAGTYYYQGDGPEPVTTYEIDDHCFRLERITGINGRIYRFIEV